MKTVKLNESQLRKLVREMYGGETTWDEDEEQYYSDVDAAFDEGERMAKSGQATNPYPSGSEEAHAWESGYENALDYMGYRGQRSRSHLRGIKPWRHEP